MAQTITLTQPQQRVVPKTITPIKPLGTNSPPPSKRVPTQRPPFSVGDIRRAIPADCFTHSYVKSFAYLAWDIAMAAALFVASTYIDTVINTPSPFLTHVLRTAAWTAYWIAQGVVFTGLWVIGHECGHGGFSASELVNDTVGMVVHSFLMVPYFSWKISHRRHHSNTGNIDRDEVFVPDVADDNEASPSHEDDDAYAHDYAAQIKATVTRAYWLVIMLTVGWPAYLIANVSSNRSYDPKKWINHFDPNSDLFQMHSPDLTKKQSKQIVMSDIGLILNVAVMTALGYKFGGMNVLFYYVIPLMQNIMWLVIITFLQHTDKQLPHYDSTEWDWLRGALATVDRDYGILNYFHHHIGDTHVVHHMFHTMPFYNAQRATEAVKPVLKDYYLFDGTPIAKALWTNYGTCDVVVPDQKQTGVYWFEK